jgi:hypothetical protein
MLGHNIMEFRSEINVSFLPKGINLVRQIHFEKINFGKLIKE